MSVCVCACVSECGVDVLIAGDTGTGGLDPLHMNHHEWTISCQDPED